MTLPTSLDSAIALLGQLVGDPNLVTGLVTVAVVLVASGVLTWALLSVARR